MELLYVVLPIALVIAAGFVAAFVWAARADQFEDLDTPPVRMLLDDPPVTGSGAAEPPPHGEAPRRTVRR
ncbi:MAG: cbb3-type cytochrome oxidase assembly protein CcoS [Phycisphaerales bacterium]